MRSKTLASVFALSALALASPAFASLSDFRLPAERPQQVPPPDLQGPVAPDVPASRRSPVTPTPTPIANEPQPSTATPAAPPVELPAGLQPAPAASAARGVTPSAPGMPEPSAATNAQVAQQPVPASTDPAAPVTALPGPTPSIAPASAAEAQGSGSSWPWLLAAVPLLLAALGAAGWAARGWTQRPIGPVVAPQIERPRVGPSPLSPTPTAPSAAPGEPLQVSLEPLRLSLTLMNATLAYRLELANRGPATLTGLAIGADMIAAHASLSREEQLSGPCAGNGSGASVQRIERLGPGESRVIEGEFRLPFPQIVPIRQGDAALLLPLVRFRVEAEGAAPTVRTFAIGQLGEGNGLQPFRLDQGPRIYPRLAQHAFA